MKLWSREALMVGGIYSVLSAPFLILKTPLTEQIDLFLFFSFILCMLFLYCPKFSLGISKQMEKYPKLSYYILSTGWIPYVLIIGIIAISICAVVFSWNDNVLNRTIGVFNLICSWGLPVSLIVAYIRTKIKVI